MLPILHSALRVPRSAFPLRHGQGITGTPAQFARLAAYLQVQTAAAPDPARLVRLQLWDGQVVVARYAELAALAAALAARTEPAGPGIPRSAFRGPRSAARYTPPASQAAAAVPFAFPAEVEVVTQTLNARGTAGGLRFPTRAEADPTDPAAWAVSGSAQPYVAQVCTADPASPWGWTPSGPLYWTPAGHILVAAVRIALAHHLLLAADQLLVLRWVRSANWTSYVPAALLNAWHLALAGALANADRRTRNAESRTARLPDLPC
jgi:hypothetical protein